MPEVPIRLLLVDDDEDEFLIARDLLDEVEGRPYRLDWEPNYESGLRTMLERRHAVHLIDYHLGPESGVELLREAKARGAETPVIILTGQGDRSVDVEAMKAGAEDFLDKGQLSTAVLDRAIRYAIERREQRAARERAEAHVETLTVMKAELETAIRVRDEFLSIASHELKTPLTPMLLQLESLQCILGGSCDIDPSLCHRLGVLKKQAGRLARLVDSLLDVSRISNGQLTLNLEPFDLTEMAWEIVERFAAEAEHAGCRLELEAPRSTEGQWDRLRMEQVLTNLISNALKYGPGRPIRVQVQPMEGTARLVVEDHGIGIAPENLGRIFGRFERAVSLRHYGGIGLGLYIAHQIVRAHGGSILVKSEPGRGSTFTVVLPMQPAAALGGRSGLHA